MVFEFMQKYCKAHTIRKMARVFEVSVSGYYDWLGREPSARSQTDAALVRKIEEVQKRHNRRYGSPRVHSELTEAGVRTSRKRIARLMKHNNLQAKRRRRWVKTTDSGHSEPPAPNLLARKFIARAPGTKWVSDITYLRTTGGWLFLTVVIDLWDRRVIGWALSDDMSSSHVVSALTMACLNRKPQNRWIFHSDRGVQYCSKEFRNALKKCGSKVRQSMSRKGNCWDNACAESFFSSLKRELTCLEGRHSKREVKLAVFEYIETYYNRVRRHSALGNLSPEAFRINAA
jgi:transposase InsO family protein